MKPVDFYRLLEHRIQKIRDTLAQKANEYATDDHLHNFKTNLLDDETKRETPVEVCWGYLRKHLQSIRDIAKGIKPMSLLFINEKIGDAIVYLILMEALIVEQIQK